MLNLVWCTKVHDYFKKQNFRVLAVFPSIFVMDIKIIYCYKFVVPLILLYVLLRQFVLHREGNTDGVDRAS